MYGLTRGTATLLGVAAAGFLVWLGTQLNADTSNGEYWAAVGLFAAAGLALALSQLLGGWTKWGWPRISGSVFLLGFLPALVVGGWILLAAQPDENWFQRRANDWAGDIGLGGLVGDLTGVFPLLALALGLVFGLVFDTTGARRPVVEYDERAATEPVAAERAEVVTGDERPVGASAPPPRVPADR